MDGEIDLKPLQEPAYKALAQGIITEVNNRLCGEIFKYKNIYLTGGGALCLWPFFAAAYPNIKLQEDAAFANVAGYLALKNTRKR